MRRLWLVALVAGCGAAESIRLELGGSADDGSGFVALEGDVDLVIRSASRVSNGRTILNALPLAYDQLVELRLEIRDGAKRTLGEASARVIPRCPSGDDFCTRICGR